MNIQPTPRNRIRSIDTVRGIIMVVMTLDHCRDFLHFQGPQYSPTNMATTTVILFFTRWVTHFCAPTFVLLSGVSAWLASQKRTRGEMAGFLIKRGLWLVLTDMLVITFIFTLNPHYPVFVLEVLWAIGCSMIVLGILVALRAPLALIGVIAGVLIVGHNLTDFLALPPKGVAGSLLTLFLSGRGAFIPIGGGRTLFLIYTVLPWTGVLLTGYVLGSLYRPDYDPARRKKLLLIAGFSLIALFVVVRWIKGYGDPAPWSTQRNAAHTLLSFLNATKQPPSLVYVSMTLGPVLVLLSLIENYTNRLTAFCTVYGNVPYFYFVVHLGLIRVINLGLIVASGLEIKSAGSPLVWQAQGFGYPLWMVYLFWALVIGLLYFPCKWYGNYKRTHRQWWLSYL